MSFPPPTAPYQPAQPTKIKPGKGWYWLGGLLLAGGIVGGLAIGIVGVVRTLDMIDNFGRFKIANGSSSAEVTFEKPGKYSIYYEGTSKVCQDLSASASGCRTETISGDSAPPSRLDITISDEKGSLDVTPVDHSFDYNFGDYAGKEVATVQVDDAGKYTMKVESDRTDEFAVALGKGVVSSILPWIIGAILVGLLGFALGLTTLIVTGVKRGRRKRSAAAAVTAYPGVPAPAPAPDGAWAPAPPPTPYGAPPPPAPPTTSPPPPPSAPPPSAPPPSGGWAPPSPPSPGGPAPGQPLPPPRPGP